MVVDSESVLVEVIKAVADIVKLGVGEVVLLAQGVEEMERDEEVLAVKDPQKVEVEEEQKLEVVVGDNDSLLVPEVEKEGEELEERLAVVQIVEDRVWTEEVLIELHRVRETVPEKLGGAVTDGDWETLIELDPVAQGKLEEVKELVEEVVDVRVPEGDVVQLGVIVDDGVRVPLPLPLTVIVGVGVGVSVGVGVT